MPRALIWTQDQDARLTALLDQRGSTLRKAAQQLGVSRSFAQRRAKLLLRQNVKMLAPLHFQPVIQLPGAPLTGTQPKNARHPHVFDSGDTCATEHSRLSSI